MTRLLHASYLSLIEVPYGLAIQVFEDGNDTRKPDAVVFVTKGQWAGVKRQIPIKLKKEIK